VALQSSGEEPGAQGAGDSSRRAIDPPVEIVAEAPDAAPRLRIVDATGTPIAGARAAAIDPYGFVHEVELDDAASAELADDSLGSRFAASAPGHGPALSQSWTAGDLELALAPMRRVQGLFLEDGEPPGQSIELRCSYPDPDWDIGPNGPAIGIELKDLGVFERWERVRTEADGSFRFQCPQEAMTASVRVPPSHVIVADDGVRVTGEFYDRDIARVRTNAGDIQNETAGLPLLFVRLIRADDGAPVVTDVTWWLEYQDHRNAPMTNMSSDLDGSFRIGLQLDEEDLLLPPSERAAQSTAHTSHVMVSGREFKNLPS
jgi:hypothetical protein